MEGETGYDWVPRKARRSNAGLEGQFVKTYICVDCEEELTWKEKMGSLGCCPYCGHTVPGTIVETHEATKKQVKEKWKRIPWRDKTDEQKAFTYGMVFGGLACILGMLMAEWTINWMAL
jgi:ribosomal protein L37AE/L43A